MDRESSLHIIPYNALTNKRRESNEPRRPREPNGFILFRSHLQRPKNMPMREFSKEASESWKKLSDDEKAKWQKQYHINRDANKIQFDYNFICAWCEQDMGNPNCNNCNKFY
jgi:hypothetical protein